jgi:hypothetical protein
MNQQEQTANRNLKRHMSRCQRLAGLGVLLAAAAGAQAQQNTSVPPPLPPRPVMPTNQHPPVVPAKPVNNLLNAFGAGGGGIGGAPAGNQGQLNSAATAAQRRNTVNPAVNNNAAAGARPASAPLRLANMNSTQGNSHLVQSRAFLGHPGPPGSTETQARNGNIVRTAADGTVMDIRSPRNNMLIHHSVDGSKHILVEQPDRSRIFASSRGIQYVQHPFVFRGHAYDHRTFVVDGKSFHEMYRPYNYAGMNLDTYASPRYYAPNLYQWALSRQNSPVAYNWPYASNQTPWFGYYRSYFTPDATYTSPQAWLADYVLAVSLFVAYKTEPGSPPPPTDGSAAITPEVKQAVADEVGHQVRQEALEAQQNAQNRDPNPGTGGVVQELADGQQHAFVVSSDLDLVDPSGRRCMVSEGDVVQVVSGPKADTATVTAVVMASKGGSECERAAQVELALNDVQEMQNHMRETIDQGLADTNAGKQAQKVTPAFAAAVPPPDPNAANELAQQQQIAAAAEG